MIDPLTAARSNLADAKAKLQKLLASGETHLVEHLPHGITDVLSRADLEKVIDVWQGEVDYHAGRTPPPPTSTTPTRERKHSSNPFA